MIMDTCTSWFECTEDPCLFKFISALL